MNNYDFPVPVPFFNPMKKSVLFIAIGSSLFAIGTAALQWPIIDKITEFLFLPLAGLIGIGFLSSFALSVVYAWIIENGTGFVLFL